MLVLLLLAPIVSVARHDGKAQTDVLSRDADWFSRTGGIHPQHFNPRPGAR